MIAMADSIDIETWGSFRLGDVFEFKGVKQSKTQLDVPDAENGIPYVVQSINNNMVSRTVDRQWLIDHNEPPQAGNAIVLGVTLPTISYQPTEFGASQVITARNANLNRYTGLFIVSVLKKYISRFGYDNKPGIRIYENMRVSLPSTDDGSPDWSGMEQYMKCVLDQTVRQLALLQQIHPRSRQADTVDWKSFKIGDLFVVTKGTRLTRANMIEGTTPFVGATLENNGITAYVGNTEHIHPGGVMTVAYNGQKAMGKAFWQPKPFWASDDVNVLYPKFELTREIALFLQPLFWEASKPFSYDDKWGKEAMERTPIMLPTDAQGEPDWQWMQQYVKQALKDADRTVVACMQLL